jgi:uncharacterized iron-regulated membrane protein
MAGGGWQGGGDGVKYLRRLKRLTAVAGTAVAFSAFPPMVSPAAPSSSPVNPLPKRLGKLRRLHHKVGAALGYLFAILGLTGILLGWEIRLGGGPQGPPPHGSTTDLRQWQPLATLVEAARGAVRDSSGGKAPGDVRRLEARPDQGLVLVQFEGAEWSAQVDAGTGHVLGMEKRRFNLVKAIHEGSIVDQLLGTDEVFMKAYTTLMGGALLVLAFTGFWLWYGPKKLRKG